MIYVSSIVYTFIPNTIHYLILLVTHKSTLSLHVCAFCEFCDSIQSYTHTNQIRTRIYTCAYISIYLYAYVYMICNINISVIALINATPSDNNLSVKAAYRDQTPIQIKTDLLFAIYNILYIYMYNSYTIDTYSYIQT